MYQFLNQRQILFKTQALLFVQVLRDSTQAESNQEKPNARVVAIRQRAEAATLPFLNFTFPTWRAFNTFSHNFKSTWSIGSISDRCQLWPLEARPGSQREIGGCIYEISDLQAESQKGNHRRTEDDDEDDDKSMQNHCI